MGFVVSEMLSDKKHAPKNLGRVLILGLGKSGKAAARYCFNLLGSRVESLTIAGGKASDDSEAFASSLIEDRRVEVSFDKYTFDEYYDLCIASPGISQLSDFYQNARVASNEVISEVEFAWRESAEDSRWVAITGTNGKTTTTALTAHIFTQAGLRAKPVGNIGDTCLEAVMKDETDVYVAEVSSYQLASTVHFAPEVAAIINITPDHLSWHGSHEEYVRAKLKVLANLGNRPGAFAVFDATDEELRSLIKRVKGLSLEERGYSYVPLGAGAGLSVDMRSACGSENGAYLYEGVLRVALRGREYDLCAADDLLIKGDHNVVNALAASSAALICGVDSAVLTEALRSFAALEHRIEPCGSVAGVDCFNDSKATNVDATLKALAAFGEKRPIVLLGGYDKGTDLGSLVEASERHAKAVVCYGAAGPRFYEAFEASKTVSFLADKLESALDQALEHAQTGDVVILSPACASFDEFDSFEHRGQVFKDLVRKKSQIRGA